MRCSARKKKMQDNMRNIMPACIILWYYSPPSTAIPIFALGWQDRRGDKHRFLVLCFVCVAILQIVLGMGGGGGGCLYNTKIIIIGKLGEGWINEEEL